MTSEQSARQRIAEYYGDCEPKHQLRNLIRTALAIEWDGAHTEDYLDDAIAIVRQALLSDEAIRAASHAADVEMFTPAGGEDPTAAILANPDGVVAAALDVAFGEEQGDE